MYVAGKQYKANYLSMYRREQIKNIRITQSNVLIAV